MSLQKRIKSVKEDEHEKTEVLDYIKELSEKLTDFSKIFEELPLIRKRDFLKEILEKVVWDGEIAHIYLRNPVPDKHRDIFRRFWENYKPQQYPKCPESNHRIATAARPDDRQKFTLCDLKTDL